MKKIVSMFAIVAFLFSVNANASEPTKDKKKKQSVGFGKQKTKNVAPEAEFFTFGASFFSRNFSSKCDFQIVEQARFAQARSRQNDQILLIGERHFKIGLTTNGDVIAAPAMAVKLVSGRFFER